MASDSTWELVSLYFKKDSRVDQWGDPDAIDDTHLLRLFDFRSYLGIPVFVTRGVQTSGHSKNSYHYPRKSDKGKPVGYATDIVIPHYDLSSFDLIMDACRFFNGVGFYPHWRWNGQVVGGLHVDSRPLGYNQDGTLDYRESRWLGTLNAEGKQVYRALTFDNLWRVARFPELEDGDTH